MGFLGDLFGGLGGPLVSAGASLLGGFLRNDSSARAAREQMDFQERMSGTAHQREVADLRAAGLNPILSATGGRGAAAPSGAMPEVQDVISPAVATALQAMRTMVDTEKTRAETANVEAQTENARTLGTGLKWDVEARRPSVEGKYQGGRDVGLTPEQAAHMAGIDVKRFGPKLAEYESLQRQLTYEIADKYGMSTAKAVLHELGTRALEQSAGARERTARARQEEVEAGISEKPGVRWVERAIRSATGASSAYRNLR